MKDKTVLIVDDEKNILLALSQSLEVLQLETDTAKDGEEALAKLKGEGVWSHTFGPQDARNGRDGGSSSGSGDSA